MACISEINYESDIESSPFVSNDKSKIDDANEQIKTTMGEIDNAISEITSNMSDGGLDRYSLYIEGSSLAYDKANEILTDLQSIKENLEEISNAFELNYQEHYATELEDYIKKVKEKIEDLESEKSSKESEFNNVCNALKDETLTTSVITSYEQKSIRLKNDIDDLEKEIKEFEEKLEKAESKLSTCQGEIEKITAEQVAEDAAVGATGSPYTPSYSSPSYSPSSSSYVGNSSSAMPVSALTSISTSNKVNDDNIESSKINLSELGDEKINENTNDTSSTTRHTTSINPITNNEEIKTSSNSNSNLSDKTKNKEDVSLTNTTSNATSSTSSLNTVDNKAKEDPILKLNDEKSVATYNKVMPSTVAGGGFATSGLSSLEVTTADSTYENENVLEDENEKEIEVLGDDEYDGTDDLELYKSPVQTKEALYSSVSKASNKDTNNSSIALATAAAAAAVAAGTVGYKKYKDKKKEDEENKEENSEEEYETPLDLDIHYENDSD